MSDDGREVTPRDAGSGRIPCPSCVAASVPMGARVVVAHATGIIESGTVRGRTNPAMADDAEFGRYDIEFDDRTRMAVPLRLVSRL